MQQKYSLHTCTPGTAESMRGTQSDKSGKGKNLDLYNTNCFNGDMTFIFMYGAQDDTNAVCHEQVRSAMLSDTSGFWALGLLILLVTVSCVMGCS